MADFADELSSLLAARGMSLRQVAGRVPCDNGYLSKLANGLKHPSPATAARLEEILEAGGRLMRHVGPDASAEPDADEVAAAAREAETDRSRLLAEPGQPSVDSLWEATLEVARAANRSALQTFSASHRLRRHAMGLAETTRRPGALSDLYVITGQATALMASTAFDLNRWDESATLARSAVSYAALVGSTSLHTWTLGLAALLANWRDEPDTALRHLHRGMQISPPGTPRARLGYIAARSYALLGDAAATAQAIDQARRDQADGTQQRDLLSDDTGGEFAFSPARAEACAASAWLDLGRGVEAKAAACRALDELTGLPVVRQPLSQVLGAQIDLATACLFSHERDQAEETLRTVVAAAPSSLANVSLSGRLARTRRVLASAYWSKDRAAQQLGEMISEWPTRQ